MNSPFENIFNNDRKAEWWLHILLMVRFLQRKWESPVNSDILLILCCYFNCQSRFFTGILFHGETWKLEGLWKM